MIIIQINTNTLPKTDSIFNKLVHNAIHCHLNYQVVLEILKLFYLQVAGKAILFKISVLLIQNI